MSRKVFRIQLEQKLATDLRKVINEEQIISINKPLNNKKRSAFSAWDKTCAIMDRLEDTVEYLNSIELNTSKHTRSAFDFFNFMNNASVIIDCISELAGIFDYDLNEANSNFSIFNQRGVDGQGTDKQYFEYLRSLCAVHPVDTSRHNRYQDNEFECSPFVAWNDGTIWREKDGDLCAVVYTSLNDGKHKRIMIKIPEVFTYVQNRYALIVKIIERIKEYHSSVIEQFRRRHIRRADEFDNYIEYLENLVNESIERFGNSSKYELLFFINLLKLKISNFKNFELYKKYCAAFEYAVQFQHKTLQNMCYEGYKNSGIMYPERNSGTTLLLELYSPDSNSEAHMEYGYQIEKTSYLTYESEDKFWAYEMIKEATPFFGKYVTFVGACGDFEHYVLVQMALYQDCLENKCILNMNIPNDLRYRLQLLSDEDYAKLLEPAPEFDATEDSQDLLKWLQEYDDLAE